MEQKSLGFPSVLNIVIISNLSSPPVHRVVILCLAKEFAHTWTLAKQIGQVDFAAQLGQFRE